MNCAEVQRDLALAAAGVLEPARQRQVREHCAECAQCAARLQEFEQIAVAHSQVAEELKRLPVQFRTSVRPAVEQRAAAVKVALSGPWRWVAPAVAAVALVLIAIALLLRKPPSQFQVQSHPVSSQRVTPAAPPQTVPSLAAYRKALSDPGEGSLDTLLNRHAQHLLPSTPSSQMHQLNQFKEEL